MANAMSFEHIDGRQLESRDSSLQERSRSGSQSIQYITSLDPGNDNYFRTACG